MERHGSITTKMRQAGEGFRAWFGAARLEGHQPSTGQPATRDGSILICPIISRGKVAGDFDNRTTGLQHSLQPQNRGAAIQALPAAS